MYTEIENDKGDPPYNGMTKYTLTCFHLFCMTFSNWNKERDLVKFFDTTRKMKWQEFAATHVA